jgi:hypothetical protein
LLDLVDGWLAGVPDEAFTDVLPLLRRTFATFSAAERRQIGARVRRLDDDGARPPDDDLDHDRAELVLATVARLLGISP